MTAQPLAATAPQHLAALGLAAVMTLASLSSMLGLAEGYRNEQMLAHAQAASRPMAAAQPMVRKLKLRA